MPAILRRGTIPLLILLLLSGTVTAQSSYQYRVDLTKVEGDQLTVELTCPKITKSSIIFYLPRIVPGTYMNSNYGKYVHGVVALDKTGKKLPVTQTGEDSWEIKNAPALTTLRYQVEDTWDSKINNKVYPMCGTNFEEGKNFVINTCGVFGYFDGMKKTPFELNFTKPANFYAATGLKPVATGSTSDRFRCATADELYDSPIMFSLPDTATIRVGDAQVLLAAYVPGKTGRARYMADHFLKLMAGAKDYLGGKLPVDKYAFIFYFNKEQPRFVDGGAWEHSYSSFYSLEDEPEEEAMENWVDISAHEFFHIVTPLTISSKEVKEFNFNETHLSKHLWLYEGSTEYYAHHMQVWTGLKTPEEFLATLSNEINYSRSYFLDTLSFTELSKESAGKWKDQYVNVYMKGPLISACIDLLLLKLSGGQYMMKDLKHDLGIKYGKDSYFNDEELFDIIGKLTYPEIKDFLLTYAQQGGKAIPYEDYFALAGVDYFPQQLVKEFSMGGIDIKPDSAGRLMIGTAGLNDFGKKMGYQPGDELVSLNGHSLTADNLGTTLNGVTGTLTEGDVVTAEVKRRGENGSTNVVTLSAPAMKVERSRKHVVQFTPNPTAAQLKIRDAWFNGHKQAVKRVVPRPGDVSSIDSITRALYEVISGPAGPRDWDRFRSLFHTDSYMAAFTAKKEFRRFTPDEYIQRNAPFFLQHSFSEKEIGRSTNRFGNITQLFSTYEYTAGTEPPSSKRGINSIELVNETGRWWIMSVTWDEESPEQPIPANYLHSPASGSR